MSPAGPLNALSFDVEEWYHAEFVRRTVQPSQRTSALASGIEIILSLLKRYQVRATFFIVGEVLLQHGSLAKRLLNSGHEIACHGMTHRPLWELGQEGFRAELEQFQSVVDATLGRAYRPQGFRAPTFSLDDSTRWTLRELETHGYQYDSSVFPLRNRLFGVDGAPINVYRPSGEDLTREDPAGRILEFPPTVLPLGPWRVPVGGGAYLRAWPRSVLTLALRWINRRRPFILYLHPWELRLPRYLPLPLRQLAFLRFRVGSTVRKLEVLLQRFRFAPAAEVLGIGGPSIRIPSTGAIAI